MALSVSVDGGSADNVLADLQSGGNFQISAAQLGAAAGGTLTDGEHTVAITATDTAGNVSTSDINFTLETTPPSLAFNLAPADQTGTAAQPATNASQVTLTGQTGAGDTVVLLSTGATTVANTSGAFQFINVALSLGGNPLTMQATDAAGNTSSDTLNVQRAAATGGTDSVLQWNQLTLQAIATDADAPTVASRALAMESLAVYDAIAAIDGTPGYLVNLTAASDASAQAAVAEAADQVLDDLYPAQITTFEHS